MYELMKKKENKIIAKLFILACLFVFSLSIGSSAFAAQPLVPCGIGPGNSNCTLCHLVLGFKNIYDYLLVLLLSATTLVVVVAGVMYMVSSGDKGMIDKAKSALTYALTAMILALTAWLIINATLSALGYKKAGSWSTFTCDTAQTTGPGTMSSGKAGGGATLPKKSSSGSGDCGAVSQAAYAMKDAGVYFQMGGKGGLSSDGRAAYDCSGFVTAIWQKAGLGNAGGSTSGILSSGGVVTGTGALNDLKGGDIVVRSSGGGNRHAGIYIGDGMVMHNSTERRNDHPDGPVKVVSVDEFMGKQDLLGVKKANGGNGPICFGFGYRSVASYILS